MNSLVEIDATDSFLSLDPNVKKCQNDEEFEDCTAREQKKALLNNCKCVPFNIRMKEQDPLCTTEEQIECSKKTIQDTIETSCKQKLVLRVFMRCTALSQENFILSKFRKLYCQVSKPISLKTTSNKLLPSSSLPQILLKSSNQNVGGRGWVNI